MARARAPAVPIMPAAALARPPQLRHRVGAGLRGCVPHRREPLDGHGLVAQREQLPGAPGGVHRRRGATRQCARVRPNAQKLSFALRVDPEVYQPAPNGSCVSEAEIIAQRGNVSPAEGTERREAKLHPDVANPSAVNLVLRRAIGRAASLPGGIG